MGTNNHNNSMTCRCLSRLTVNSKCSPDIHQLSENSVEDVRSSFLAQSCPFARRLHCVLETLHHREIARLIHGRRRDQSDGTPNSSWMFAIVGAFCLMVSDIASMRLAALSLNGPFFRLSSVALACSKLEAPMTMPSPWSTDSKLLNLIHLKASSTCETPSSSAIDCHSVSASINAGWAYKLV